MRVRQNTIVCCLNEGKMDINENEVASSFTTTEDVKTIQEQMGKEFQKDKDMQMFFRQNHEKLKESIDILCENWQAQLEGNGESGGLKRIYVDGYVHYVSEFYYKQVDYIDGYEKI
eukprot:g5745.t1